MDATQPTCPGCGETGRKVHAITPDSLLNEEARARLVGSGDLRFCKRGDCDVVYFGEGGLRFSTADVSVPVFQKSSDPERFACYCFEHTVASITDEVNRTGASEVPDLIAAKCRAGLDRCEEMNPQGACCLGNVRQVVRAAIATPAEAEAAPHDCCVPATAPRPSARP